MTEPGMHASDEPASGPLHALRDISDPDLRSGVVDLFERARELVAGDVVQLVVLSARRLACLYELLLENGFPAIQGAPVVSDRYLDTASSWEGISSVLVLDDSVVLGTTLDSLNAELRAKLPPGGEVYTNAVCLDTEQCARYLLDDLQFTVLHERSSKEVEEFSTNVVLALFRGGVPFFSDFPSTVQLSTTVGAWNHFLTDSRWHVADVTAPLLDQSARRALVQVPTDETTNHVLARILPQVASLVETFKVRSYVQSVDPLPAFESPDAEYVVSGDSTEINVKFVPIAMLMPAAPETLDVALGAICEALSPWQECPTDGWLDLAPTSKHRLVQLFASAAVLPAIYDDKEFEATFGMPLHSDVWEQNSLTLYFGPATPGVLAAFDKLAELLREGEIHDLPARGLNALVRPRESPRLAEPEMQEILWQQRELFLWKDALPSEPDPGQLTKVGLVFAHGIFSVFGFISEHYERPQRLEIADLKSRKLYDETFGADPDLRILNQGLTMHELTAALTPNCVGGTSWQRAILSLGIDVGNDLGIVVPDTRYDTVRGVVYRCYRLGETAPLASKPLPRSVENQDWDQLTLQLESDYPLLSHFVSVVESPIRLADNPAREKWAALSALNSQLLVNFVGRRVPGRPRLKFEGVVTQVDGDEFQAELTEWPHLGTRSAVMRSDGVSDDERDFLVDGATFQWSVYDSDGGPGRSSTSILRLHRPRALDLDQMTRDADALASLDDQQ